MAAPLRQILPTIQTCTADKRGLTVMLVPVLLLAVLKAEAIKHCYDDLDSFQCSSIDDKGYTPFWTNHRKRSEDKWSANFFLTDKTCTVNDALNFITHSTGNMGKDEIIKSLLNNGYQRYGDSIYKFYENLTYWDYGRRVCLNDGAHLAIPNSKDELEYFGGFVKNKNAHAFIGVHDIFNEGEHLTVFGEPAEVAFQDFYEVAEITNDKDAGLAGEDCCAIQYSVGRLIKTFCGRLRYFICELEMNEYPPQREINYNAGPYTGIETVKRPIKSRVERRTPPKGYEYFPGFGFYRYHTTPEVWFNALKICEEEGGHLAVINSKYEHDILMSFFDKVPHRNLKETDDGYRALIGIHALFGNRTFVTIFNETLEDAGFAEWGPNEPNNLIHYHESSGQQCGCLVRTGKLDDTDCCFLFSYFCELDLFEYI